MGDTPGPNGFRLAQGLACLVLVTVLAACGGRPSAIIGVDGKVPAAAVPGATPVDIFIATSRQEADNPQVLFSGERSDGLSFARVTVFVPPERRPGETSRPDTLPPDPRRHFVIVDPRRYETGGSFVRAVDAEIAEGPGREVLVFVHGFNNDLASAVVRTAQFVHDSGYKGVPVLFTWPSRGQALSYVYDMNSVLQSRDALAETARLLGTTDARSFDLLAHSLGNLLAVEGLRQLTLTGEFGEGGRVSNVMLASPDIDFDLFARQLETLRLDRSRIYVMVATQDRALAISRTIAGGVSRVGNADPEALAGLGVTVVDVSQVRDSDFARHTQFASVPEVVTLVGDHMRRTGDFTRGDDDEPGGALRDALVGVTLIPARIVGGGRVLAISN